MDSGQRNPWIGKRLVLLCGILVVAVGASLVWWQQSRAQGKTALPSRLCNDTFSSAEVKSLYGESEGALKQDTIRGFPGAFGDTPGLGVVCETSLGNRSVNFRAKHMRWGKPKKELMGEVEYVTELGSGYGDYNKDRGEISLRIPCPSSETPTATLYMKVGASLAGAGPGEGVSKLKRLAGYAARTLAQNVYKCKGADELPEGPVHIRRGEGSR